MSSRFWRWTAFSAALAQCLTGAALAQSSPPADPTCWIVLRGGSSLAARCPYEQRGEELRFRGLDGVLVALPLALVDLEATASARARPSPRAARVVALESAQPPEASAVGMAGEAAKRAGHRGAFVDLSRMVVPAVEPRQAAPQESSRTATPGARLSPAQSSTAAEEAQAASRERTAAWWAYPPPSADSERERERVLRLRVKRGGKPPG